MLLANGKAPGNDAIPPEVIKKGYQFYFPNYMNFFPSAGDSEIPQDMHDAKIVTLFMNKGDRSNCDNYH